MFIVFQKFANRLTLSRLKHNSLLSYYLIIYSPYLLKDVVELLGIYLFDLLCYVVKDFCSGVCGFIWWSFGPPNLMILITKIMKEISTLLLKTQVEKRVSFSIVFSDWRGFSHLRPFLHRRSTVIPFCYWLLLFAGDVAVNLGPVKYLCRQCTQPVQINQRGILCDRCELWTHAKCCGVSNEDYRSW